MLSVKEEVQVVKDEEGVPVGGQLHELQPVYGGTLGGDAPGQPTFLQDMGVLVDSTGQDPNYALLQKEVTESMYVLASDEHYGRSPPAAGCDQVDAHQSLEQSIALQIGQRAVDQAAPAATEMQSVSSAGAYALQPGAGDEGAWQSATEVDMGGVTYIVPDGSGAKGAAPPRLAPLARHVSHNLEGFLQARLLLGPGLRGIRPAHPGRRRQVQWLLENYETAEGQSLPRYALYTHYLYHCQENGFEPVNAASFGKLIRAVFLGLRTRRLGTRGNSKYHYYGIRVKPGSKLNGIPLASPAGGKQRGAQRRPGSSPGPFCLGGGTYTPCRPVALPQTRIFGDASKAIPEFPPIELPPGYDLPRDDIEIFHYVYKEHLEAFLDALVNLELGTVESLLHEFWRSSCVGGDETEEEKYFPKSKLYVLCDCPYVQQLVESVDFHFYQNLLWLLVPDVLKPLSGTHRQRP
ncbi:transcription factor RFX3-like [Bacillus rossius redtenbacheri]|uniref:transcription factor RFX3-like n=1 Tax=Bacillus rossius redtenbacheri TaxID=93214 RepID=UPI002FDCC37A